MSRVLALVLALGASAAGCGGGNGTPPPVDYQQNRWDYFRFEERVGALPSPNYLPWAMHREVAAGEEVLVACRWPDAAFPLRYFVAAPDIPEELAGETVQRRPADYVAAVDDAFAAWQKAIGGPVRFERTEDPDDAALAVHLTVKIEDVPEAAGQVLGVVRGEADRCSVTSADATPDRVEIQFAPKEATLFIADSMGLLTPRQVRAVALHEIGHLLGVSGQHSPLAGDVMYEVAGDRRIEALSEHDKNTLRALYRIPPGTVYARLAEVRERPENDVRAEPPKLADETRDARHGFAVHFPKRWQKIPTPNGWIAVDGVSWDYDASIQVISARGSVGSYLSLLAGKGRARGDDVRSEFFELDGAPVARLISRGSERAEQTDLVDWGDGLVLVVMADSRSQDFEFYRPWFQRVLLSVEPVDPKFKPSQRLPR
jgi:hypothetical protein